MAIVSYREPLVHVHYDYGMWHGAYAIVTAKDGTIYHGILASWLDGRTILFDWLITADEGNNNDDEKTKTSVKKAVLFDVDRIDTLVGYMHDGSEVVITSCGFSSLTSRCGMVDSLEMAQQLEVEGDAQ
jgi:hypothetical protein